MSAQDCDRWVPLHFHFADNSKLTIETQLLDAVINDLAIESGRPDLRIKCAIDELYQPSALRFNNSAFPYLSLWFRYAQILTIEKHAKYTVPPTTDLLRTILFEYLRIAEYIFCLATFSLNIGLNKILSDLLEQYESVGRLLAMLFKNMAPEEFVSGLKGLKVLPIGFCEQALNTANQISLSFQELLPMLLNNRIVRARCQRMDDQIMHRLLNFNSGPNRRATGTAYDYRYDFSYSSYQYLFFDRVTVLPIKKRTGFCWQRLRVRCDEIFISIYLIKQAVARLVYLTESSNSGVSLSTISKGHTSATIETPWSALTCQMNYAGSRESCEFILTNPLYEIGICLRQIAIGLDLSDLPLLIASLGLRPNMEPL